VRRAQGLQRQSPRGVSSTHAEELVALEVAGFGAHALEAALHLDVDRAEVEGLRAADLRDQCCPSPIDAYLVRLQARAEQDLGCGDEISVVRASRWRSRSHGGQSPDARARR